MAFCLYHQVFLLIETLVSNYQNSISDLQTKRDQLQFTKVLQMQIQQIPNSDFLEVA